MVGYKSVSLMKQGWLRFETFELDLDSGELYKEGTRIPLQDQPTRLLVLLAQRRGELVTRDDIQRELWKGGEVVEYEHSINTAILRIRKALDDSSETPRIIETFPRRGYKFKAPAELLEPDPATGNPGVKKEPLVQQEFVLPVSVTVCRILFLLAQIPYVASYAAAFFYFEDLDPVLARTFSFIPVERSLPALLVLASTGFAIRVYLIGLVGWGHTEAGPRYRRLFPFVFILDAAWAATPLLLEKESPLVAWLGLILMGWLIFGQRTLMLSIERRQAKQRVNWE